MKYIKVILAVVIIAIIGFNRTSSIFGVENNEDGSITVTA